MNTVFAQSFYLSHRMIKVEEHFTSSEFKGPSDVARAAYVAQLVLRMGNLMTVSFSELSRLSMAIILPCCNFQLGQSLGCHPNDGSKFQSREMQVQHHLGRHRLFISLLPL